jgi:hypothetical protein
VGFVLCKVVLGRVFSKYFGFLANLHSANYSTITAKQWLTYKVQETEKKSALMDSFGLRSLYPSGGMGKL